MEPPLLGSLSAEREPTSNLNNQEKHVSWAAMVEKQRCQEVGRKLVGYVQKGIAKIFKLCYVQVVCADVLSFTQPRKKGRGALICCYYNWFNGASSSQAARDTIPINEGQTHCGEIIKGNGKQV